MASSSERLWITLTVAAGTLVVAVLVLSAPAVQRCGGAAEGIWSCLRQQVIDYGLLPADETAPPVLTSSDQPTPSPESQPVAPTEAPTSETPIVVAEPSTAPAPASRPPASANPPATEPEAPTSAPPAPVATSVEPTPPLQPDEPALDPDETAPGASPEPSVTPAEPTFAAPETPASPPEPPVAALPTTSPTVPLPSSEPPLQTAEAPEPGAPADATTPTPQPPPTRAPEDRNTPPTQPEAQRGETQAPEQPAPLPAPLPPESPLTPALPEAVLTATAEVAGSALAALKASTDLVGTSLRLSAAPVGGISVALLSGLTLEPPQAVPAVPGPVPATPLRPSPASDDVATPTPEEPEGPAASTTTAEPPREPLLANPSLQPLAPAIPNAPLVAEEELSGEDVPDSAESPAVAPAPKPEPLQPSKTPGALKPAPLQPAAGQDEQPADAAATGPDGSRLADLASEPAETAEEPAPPPAPEPPPGPTIFASASLGTAPSAKAAATPTIDAVEIDGRLNLFAGTGPEGARIDLFVGNRYIDSAVVEGGRWLVEAESVLRLPAERLRVSLAPEVSARASAGSEAILLYNVAPPGVRLVGAEAAAAAPQVDSELELDPAMSTLQPLETANPDLLRFQSGKAIIRRGDTLWAIARRVYGRGIFYDRIFEANREQIRRPGRIYPGQVFDLPKSE